MKRSPVGLLIVVVLIGFALYSSGVVSWHPTPWETHAARTVAKDAGKAAKDIGVTIHDPPQPPGITPAPSTTSTTTTQAQSVTTLYPTPSGQAIPAPTATQSVTSAYCALERVSAATCQQALSQDGQ